MMDSPAFVMRGLQRSGTSWLTAMAFANFKAEAADAGDKHGAMGEPPLDRPFVLITKDPYAWMVSVWEYFGRNRRYYKGEETQFTRLWPKDDMPFHLFVRGAWPFECRPSQGWNGKTWCPAEYWTEMNRQWIYWPGCMHVRYGDLLREPRWELARIRRHFGLELRDERGYVNVDLEMGPLGHRRSSLDTMLLLPPNPVSLAPEPGGGPDTDTLAHHAWPTERRAYYRERRYMDAYSGESLQDARQDLDVGLMAETGYRIR